MLPWGYKRAFLCCALLFLLGTVIQLIWGAIPSHMLHYPWSVIAALVYTYALVLVYSLSERFPRLKRLYDPYASVAAIVSVTVLSIVFGLVPQTSEGAGALAALGWTDMRSSWAFNFLLLYMMTGMGISAISGLYHLKSGRFVPTLSHLAVFLVLAGAFFGSGDKVEVLVTAEREQPLAVGENEAGEAVELPFMLVLNDFVIDEYPARLQLSPLEGGMPSKGFLLADAAGNKGLVGDWTLEVLEAYDMAATLPEAPGYREMKHVGACPAVRVRATRDTLVREGWVSCGSFLFDGATLDLGDGQVVKMPRRMPKRYLSDVTLRSGKGEKRVDITVNHPAHLGPWMIYQSGYDMSRGRWSNTSELLCVKDGWYPLIAVGLWMLLGAGVLMFLTAGGRRQTKKEEDLQ